MLHLKEVHLPFREESLVDRYREITPDVVNEIREVAPPLRGRTILHINATPIGGGVAELLHSQIRLERSLGLESHWLVIEGAPVEFFDITKKMHNMLQGKAGGLSEEERGLYLRITDELADSLLHHLRRFQEPLIIVHDPQPLGMIQNDSLPTASMALRLHIDLSSPNASLLEFLHPYLKKYPRIVLSSEEYIPAFGWYDRAKIDLIPPAIDPLTEKNQPMKLVEARKILARFGIDGTKPLLTQVSRFDPWKDPVGVIRAFRSLQKNIPGVQLALAGFITAKDDPEAVTFVKKVERARKSDEHIFLFSDPAVLDDISNDMFVSALLTASDVIIQKSLREGFGLTMTEAMWKAKPLIAGDTVGGRMQVVSGQTGFIVHSPAEVAETAVLLLEDSIRAKHIGHAAKESVREKFIITRYILDHLHLYEGMQKSLPKTTLLDEPRMALNSKPSAHHYL